jgi:anti-sigma B factor antagonist
MLSSLAAEPLGPETENGALLSVSGELDIATAPQLRAVVSDLLGQGFRHVEVDLDNCAFIDSSGMGALLWAAHRLHAAGGDLVALHAHGATMRTLEMSGVDRVLAMHN